MTSEEQRTLLHLAREAAQYAYVPYSHFPVGAAIRTANGALYSGCNVENASYPLTNCAERTAVFKAVSEGHRDIVAVAVSAPRSPGTSPCGACRQVLNEFRPEGGDMLVILDDGEEGVVTSIEALLPLAFGPRNLEANSRENTHAG